MTTKLVQAGTVKEGSFIIADGAACKVLETTHSKSGKHGSAKMRFMAIGLLDGRKRDVVMPASDNIEVPIIEKKAAQVLSVSGDVANLMDLENYETFDLKIPEDLKATVIPNVQVLYWIIMGEKVMKQLRSSEN